ncbi:Sm protein [Trichomonas vaginalis G3]|uniref:Sm protein n=1 Tax=Trichomonas vaginalis (strain ATCC PRA-98 / G3) TaxID=412133 RepID=A2FZR2_TRIV3|nr:SMART like-Sm ribonucleoprotein, eukaryotic and archaea-type, core family [Trichomonas vaginalis G3]EAX89602.1 Sm protein [Trichomonas vaginalis G3]KAI5512104.1 SMART like-Sm ribonucleoprotein, eukaryotic and archaea-type, core family [Trichomonas vaginalis G3]|eukprot:XP_001302532.1 Sm protein [Trichomonas vaginalis G3]
MDKFPFNDHDPYYMNLREMIGHKVFIKLENNRELEGTLMSLDQFGNLVLNDTVELQPGSIVPRNYQPKKLGTAVVRSPHILSTNLVRTT